MRESDRKLIAVLVLSAAAIALAFYSARNAARSVLKPAARPPVESGVKGR